MPADPFQELLERAFAAARDSGKPGWNRMILAVLRNRLLQLTNHGFKVRDHGAQSLLELVSRHRGLIEIDRTTKPVVIEWLGPLTVAPPAHARRIRPDLWRAAVDLRSGLQYEWDAAAGQARAVRNADPTRRLPTVDAATLAAWRRAFVDEHGATLAEPRDRERLQGWLATALGRQGLPGALRTQWSEYLKCAVAAHLTSWFRGAGYPIPDLFGDPLDEATTAVPAPDE